MLKNKSAVQIIFLIIFGLLSILIIANYSSFDSLGVVFIFPLFFIITLLGIFQRGFIIFFVISISCMMFSNLSSFDETFPITDAIFVLILTTILGLPLFFKSLDVLVIEIVAFSIGILFLALIALVTGEITGIQMRVSYRMVTHTIHNDPFMFWFSFSFYLAGGAFGSYKAYKKFKERGVLMFIKKADEIEKIKET